MMYGEGDIVEEEFCQCINCRLARMEKQISTIQNDFQKFLNESKGRVEVPK